LCCLRGLTARVSDVQPWQMVSGRFCSGVGRSSRRGAFIQASIAPTTRLKSDRAGLLSRGVPCFDRPRRIVDAPYVRSCDKPWFYVVAGYDALSKSSTAVCPLAVRRLLVAFARRLDNFHHLDCGEHVVDTAALFVTRLGIASRILSLNTCAGEATAAAAAHQPMMILIRVRKVARSFGVSILLTVTYRNDRQ